MEAPDRKLRRAGRRQSVFEPRGERTCADNACRECSGYSCTVRTVRTVRPVRSAACVRRALCGAPRLIDPMRRALYRRPAPLLLALALACMLRVRPFQPFLRPVTRCSCRIPCLFQPFLCCVGFRGVNPLCDIQPFLRLVTRCSCRVPWCEPLVLHPTLLKTSFDV